MNYSNELDVVCAIAREGGALILSYFRTWHPQVTAGTNETPEAAGATVPVQFKPGNEPVTEADQAVNALCVARLRAAFPGDALLTEELPDDGSRHGARRAWLVDPIDGTKDFIVGWPGFSLMIGLLVDAEPVLGVVYQPLGDVLYYASAGQGAYRVTAGAPPQRLRVSPIDTLSEARMVSSASHPDPLVSDVRQQAGIRDEIHIGSVGLKLSLIAAGERDLYITPYGRTKLWDTCAPHCILSEAGGRLTDTLGNTLSYSAGLNHAKGLVGTNGLIHDQVIERLRPLLQPQAG